MKTKPDILAWDSAAPTQGKLWRAENRAAQPKRLVLADDIMQADLAYKLAAEGCALLWQGDFQNARQLLQALARRCDRPKKGATAEPAAQPGEMAQLFHRHRQKQAQRAHILGMVLVPLTADYIIPLRRAPDVTEACREAYGEPAGQDSIVSLRELQSLIGAHEWRKKGVSIPALGTIVEPHYGVFSPVRGEYVDLVASAALPDTELAFDIGTGSGVLAAVLARRGIREVIATDTDPRALHCAQVNIDRLGLHDRVRLVDADMFPAGQAGLVVCNPPWVPARANAPIEHAVYDPDSQMLRAFLAGLRAHLTAQGEGWLILSDIAEHLGLRSRATLLEWISAGGLQVQERLDATPTHRKAVDRDDPLYLARSREVTSLWRLVPSGGLL